MLRADPFSPTFMLGGNPYFRGWGFQPPWFFEKVVVRKASKAETAPKRAVFNRFVRAAFVERIWPDLPVTPWDTTETALARWGVHHILPLDIDGDNDWLALVAAQAHNEVHLFINR